MWASAGWLVFAWVLTGLDDHHGRVKLWRIVRYVSQSRRTICLPERSLQSPGWIFIWLEFFRRNSNRNHRRSRRGIFKIRSLSGPRIEREEYFAGYRLCENLLPPKLWPFFLSYFLPTSIPKASKVEKPFKRFLH